MPDLCEDLFTAVPVGQYPHKCCLEKYVVKADYYSKLLKREILWKIKYLKANYKFFTNTEFVSRQNVMRYEHSKTPPYDHYFFYT